MSDDGTVNSRIVDSVASVVTLTTGQSPSQSFSMLDAVMVETLGMAMHSAVMRQQGASMVGTAATTAACAKMLQAPFPIVPPPPLPIPPLPPHIDPLPGPPAPQEPSVLMAEALAGGELAISVLQTEAAKAQTDAAKAQADLNQLITEAGGTPPAPAPPPPPPGGDGKKSKSN